MRIQLIASILLTVLFAVTFSAGCIAEETAEVGDTVSVYYTLTLDDGTVQESNVGKTPLTFTVGSGQMISGFDNAVVGMTVGETKTVRLAPADAYGEITDDMMTEMKLSDVVAGIGKEPAVGETFSVSVTTSNGERSMYAKVMEINETADTVRVAVISTPLVGEYLTFEITLDSIA